MRKLAVILLTLVQVGFVCAEGSFKILEEGNLPDVISGKSYTAYINFIYSGKGTPSASLIGKNLPAGLSLIVENKANGVGSVKISGLTYAIKDGPPRLITTNIVDGVKDIPYKGYMEVEYSTDAPRLYISGTPVGLFTTNSESRKSTEYISYPLVLLITDNEGASITKDLLLKVYKGIYAVDFYGTPSRVGNYPITVLMNYDDGSYPTTLSLSIREAVVSPQKNSEVNETVLLTQPVQKQTVNALASKKTIAVKNLPEATEESVQINKNMGNFSTSSSEVGVTQESLNKGKNIGFLNHFKEKIKSILINLIKNL